MADECSRVLARWAVIVAAWALPIGACGATPGTLNACDPLATIPSQPEVLTDVVGAGRDANDTLYVLVRDDGWYLGMRLYISSGDTLQEIVGFGERAETFTFLVFTRDQKTLTIGLDTSEPTPRLGLAEALFHPRDIGDVVSAGEMLEPVDQATVHRQRVLGLPTDFVLQNAARTQDDHAVVVVRPEGTYEGVRLFYGAGTELEEKAVQRVTLVQCGTFKIDFTMADGTWTVEFAQCGSPCLSCTSDSVLRRPSGDLEVVTAVRQDAARELYSYRCP